MLSPGILLHKSLHLVLFVNMFGLSIRDGSCFERRELAIRLRSHICALLPRDGHESSVALAAWPKFSSFKSLVAFHEPSGVGVSGMCVYL